MDCKEFEKLIPVFVKNEMDFRIQKKFNEHRMKCKECREELVIQFLVTEGIQRLEDGNAFDLQKELDYALNDSEKHVDLHMKFMKGGLILEGIAFAAILGVLLWLVL